MVRPMCGRLSPGHMILLRARANPRCTTVRHIPYLRLVKSSRDRPSQSQPDQHVDVNGRSNTEEKADEYSPPPLSPIDDAAGADAIGSVYLAASEIDDDDVEIATLMSEVERLKEVVCDMADCGTTDMDR